MSQLSASLPGEDDDDARDNPYLTQDPSSSPPRIHNPSVPPSPLYQAVQDRQLIDHRMADRHYDAPPFDDTVVLHPILTSSKQRLEPDIYAQLHQGFFQVAGTWTCYRRNYFSASCSFALWPPHDTSQLFLQLADGPKPIKSFYMTIAVVANGTEDNVPQLFQHIPKRNRRPSKVKLSHTVQSSLLSPISEPVANNIPLSNTGTQESSNTLYMAGDLSDHIFTFHTFEGLQFRKATANNGKRRAQQQYYNLVVELRAEINNLSGSIIKIARKLSAPIIVRGRSPGHYNHVQEEPTTFEISILQPSFRTVEHEVDPQPLKPQQEVRHETGSSQKKNTDLSAPAPGDDSCIEETSSQSKEVDTFDKSSISSASDVFSLRTISTTTSFSAPSDSISDLIDLLLTDEGFKALCEDGFSLLGADRFERNFRRLLKIYWSDLLHKASSNAEAQVVRFAKRNLRTITGRIRIITERCTKKNAQDFEKWDGVLSTGPSEPQEQPDGETDLSSEDDIDDEDETIFPEAQYSVSLKAFLMKGDAFEDLREGLLDYVVPFLTAKWENEHSPAQTPSYVMRELHERYQHKRSRRNVVNPQKMDRILLWASIASRFINRVGYRVLSLCRKLNRPTLKPGYKRFEWICECGEPLWGDFQVNAVSLRALTSLLARPHLQTQSTLESSHVVNLQPLPYAYWHHGMSASGTHESGQNVTFTPLPRTVFENSPGTHGRHPTPMVNKYLELCVNIRGYEIGLGEIRIRTVDSNIVSDGQLFLKIKETYDGIRKSLMFHRLGLFKPADIRFVKFCVEDGEVGIWQSPSASLPSKEEIVAKTWEFCPCPCPLSDPPPIPTNVFLHLLNSKRSHVRDTWLNRLPKKLNSSIHHDPALLHSGCQAHGWGIHIIEGANKVAIMWLTLVTVSVSFFFALLWAVFMRDVQGAFGIAAFIVASEAALAFSFFSVYPS